MTEYQQLEQVIAHLENQRLALGDEVTDAALAPLRARLAALNEHPQQPLVELPSEPESAPFAGERRVVTILFCDVKGSTAMAEKLDPEEWAGTIRGTLGLLTEPVRRHGGTLVGVRGDGILALFGAPLAHEDDPRRAVLAGLEIIDAIRSAGRRLQRERGMDLNVRVGIHTGLVVVGGLDGSGQAEYTPFGDAVNLAARMEQTAHPGTVQISLQTYRLIEELFECRPLGRIKVKGKAEPVTAYRVIAAKAGAPSSRGLEREGLASPLVGREKEIQASRGMVESLRRGQGGVLGVIGEAGLGKSRLKKELCSEAQDIQWLEGRTLSYGQTISYWPFREILRAWAGINENDAEIEAWRKLEERVVALFPGSAQEILPYLATLLAVEVQDEYIERVRYLDGDAMGKRIFLAMRRLVERLARTQPLVLVFEDLHWMDASSAALLEHLLPVVLEAPLLLVSISRPDPVGAAARLQAILSGKYADFYTEIHLAPLSARQSNELLKNLLSVGHLPAQLREAVTRKAEGNPFFIEEIIRSLLDTGAIVRDPSSGRWHIAARLERLHIPDTVQGVIMARIDRLDEQVKQTLRIAAVIGRSFLYRILLKIEQTKDALDLHLTQLQQLELIREKQVQPELEYMFIHALAQEAAYESILIQERHDLHERVAAAVETLFADRLDEFYSLLAYHYARAENWQKAQEYLLKSGDQAGMLAADAEALAHYQQAAQAYGRAFGERWDPVQRAMLERKIGTALYRHGHTEKAAKHLRAALECLGSPVPETAWAQRLAILGEVLLQAAHLLFPSWFVAPLNAGSTPVLEEKVLALEQLTWISFYAKLGDALLVSLRLLNESERSGYARGIAFGLRSLGSGLALVGQFGLARNYLRRSLKAARFSRDPMVLGRAFVGLWLHYGCLAGLERSLSFCRLTIKLSAQIGDLSGWSTAMNHSAVMYCYEGQLEIAERTIREEIDLGRELSDPVMISYGLSTLGFALRRMGKPAEAEKCLLESMELSEQIKNQYSVVSAGGELGRCYLRMGEVEKAARVLEASQAMSRRYKTGWGGQMPLALGLVELYLAWGKLRMAERASREALKQGRLFRPALPDAMRLRGSYEWLLGRSTAAMRWWQRGLALAENQGQRYDAGIIHLEIGEHMNDRAHLEQANMILGEIGARQDFERARELLASSS